MERKTFQPKEGTVKKKIPIKIYEEIKPGMTTPFKGAIVNEGGKLYIVTII